MNRYQRARIDLREQARHRVRVATRWAALGSGALAAAFAVVLTHHSAAATPQSPSAPAVTPPGASTGNSGQNSGPALQPPVQAPSVGFGYGNYSGSGGS
jgi:hypothetical protein